jgi:type I restriction enzyme S subunit
MFFRAKPDADAHFLSAFCNSRHGSLSFIRLQRGSIIPGVSLLDIPTMEIYWPNSKVRQYLGDKIRYAERLQESVRAIEVRLKGTFAYLTDGLPQCPRAWRTTGLLLESYRLNPSHYDPVALKMLQEARAKVKLSELGSLVGDHGLSGGATPLGATYCDSGVFFVRVQNVKPYRLDLSDAAYLSHDQDEQIARSRCRANDIIFSITGYPGTASLVMDDDLPININQHSVRFDVHSPYDAAYIVAAMNSRFVKRQVDRLAIGGTREALDYPSVRSLLIPLLDDSLMKSIGHSVRVLNTASRLSQRLVAAAKWVTEGLIEGKISESELAEIQHAIENGDLSADRSLLDRITANGLDQANSSKLFPNLDALYQTVKKLDPSGNLEAE